MISKAASVDEFMKTVSAEERAIFTKLRTLFLKYAPDTEAMRWGFPSYVAGETMIGGRGESFESWLGVAAGVPACRILNFFRRS